MIRPALLTVLPIFMLWAFLFHTDHAIRGGSLLSVSENGLQGCETYALWFQADAPGDAPERIVLPDGKLFSIVKKMSVSTEGFPLGQPVPVKLDLVILPDEPTKSDRFKAVRLSCIIEADPNSPALIPKAETPYVAGVPYQLHWMNFLIAWYGVNEVERGTVEGDKYPVFLFPGEKQDFIHDAYGQFLCSTPKDHRDWCDKTLGGATKWHTILTIGLDPNN